MASDLTSDPTEQSDPSARRKIYRVLFVVLVLAMPLVLGLAGALVGSESSGDGDMAGVGTIFFAIAGFALWAVSVIATELVIWLRRKL